MGMTRRLRGRLFLVLNIPVPGTDNVARSLPFSCQVPFLQWFSGTMHIYDGPIGSATYLTPSPRVIRAVFAGKAEDGARWSVA